MFFVNVSRRQDTVALRSQRHSGRIDEHSANTGATMETSVAETAAAKGACRRQCGSGKITAETGVAQTGVAEEHVAIKVLAENASSGDEDFLHGAAR